MSEQNDNCSTDSISSIMSIFFQKNKNKSSPIKNRRDFENVSNFLKLYYDGNEEAEEIMSALMLGDEGIEAYITVNGRKNPIRILNLLNFYKDAISIAKTRMTDEKREELHQIRELKESKGSQS